MTSPCRWEMLLLTLWILAGFVPGTHGIVNHLSREDILLLKDEQDPKCFTRTGEDFTCFFETADNRTYDFFYTSDELTGQKRCEMFIQKTEEGAFLHICSFPYMDVLLYVVTVLKVVERNTNTSYNRNVSVEDQFLLEPPFNTSLHPNDQAGQLQVSWHSKLPKYFEREVIYRIRYSSKELGEKTKEEANEAAVLYSLLLDSLVPGEEVEVQVSVKVGRGHWSSWSHPVQAVVPQSADDISLMCHTSDLQTISCQWNGSRYGVENEYTLFYKMSLGESSRWTNWTECVADRNLTDFCRFHGGGSQAIRVKLNNTSAPLRRTFFTQEFTLNNCIKTSPPSHPRGALENDKLCLKWEAPLLSLSAQLQYEVSYKIAGGGTWMTVSLKAPESATCLDVPAGKQYSVKLRAKPNGVMYSGHWSDWSDVLIGDSPADRGTLLLLCIPVLMLIIASILISVFYTHFSKLKLYFWPPVPNLDKYLAGFLTEINGHRWDPPITAKQCSDETTSSVVEILSEDEVSGLGKPSEESTKPLLPEMSLFSREQVNGDPQGTEVFQDYVTLNKDSVILCPKGNTYVHKQVAQKEGPGMREELFQTCHCFCGEGPVCVSPCFGTDFLNQAYMALAEPADILDCKVPNARGPGNLYTNFPCG